MKYVKPGGTLDSLYDDMLHQYHLMIAGQTGSGKSVAINGLIYTALYHSPLEQEGGIRFILIDPKMLELGAYKNLPHTITYADKPAAIIAALKQASDIMEQRLARAKKARVKEWTQEGDLYVIVDEFADLMLEQKKQAEPILAHIAQLGRAVHVHLVLATQSPSRQVITPRIKLNISASAALHCREAIESRQILGHKGAEELPQWGECIYQTPYLEGTYNVYKVPEEAIAERVRWWEKQKNPISRWCFRRNVSRP